MYFFRYLPMDTVKFTIIKDMKSRRRILCAGKGHFVIFLKNSNTFHSSQDGFKWTAYNAIRDFTSVNLSSSGHLLQKEVFIIFILVLAKWIQQQKLKQILHFVWRHEPLAYNGFGWNLKLYSEETDSPLHLISIVGILKKYINLLLVITLLL